MPHPYRRFTRLMPPAMTALAAAALFAPGGAHAAALDPPPDAIELSFQLAGEGVQRYVCTAKKEGAPDAFEWVLKEPVARLFDSSRQEVGSHSAGPTWTAKDGSKVEKKRLIASADSPSPGAIPWLLLEVEPSGAGILGRVRYVKRIDTVGGKAPAAPLAAMAPMTKEAPCDASHAGATHDVPYTATYVFFVGKAAAKPPPP